MRRHLIGIFSLLFVLGGLALLASPSDARATGSICLRAGLVLGAIWLAFPQLGNLLSRFPTWLTLLLGCLLLVAVFRSRAVVIILPLIAAVVLIQAFGWLLKPLPKSKPPPSARADSTSPSDGVSNDESNR